MKTDRARFLPWVILACGVVYTLALQALPADGAPFSCDGGLKWLQTARFARGDLHADIRLDAPPWAQALWKDGLHPLAETTYEIEGSLHSPFPYTFPLVSAPFYWVFGERGLYLLPLIGLWVLWLALLLAVRPARVGGWISAGALLAVIASGLTPYCAIFWEHTPAIALAFLGMQWIFRVPDELPSPRRMALSGICLGAAGWLRPECSVLLAALLVATFLTCRRELGRKRLLYFALASLVTAGGSLLANYYVYGHVLGTHAFSVIHSSEAMSDRMQATIAGMEALSRAFLLHVPITAWLALALLVLIACGVSGKPARVIGFWGALVVLAVAWCAVPGTGGYKMAATMIGMGVLALCARAHVPLSNGSYAALLAALATAVITPAITPGTGGYQIGPRFLYPIIPIVAVVSASIWIALRNSRPQPAMLVRGGMVVAFLVLVGGGVWVNLGARSELARNYGERVVPTLEFLRASPAEVVAVTRSWLVQDLAAVLDEKVYFFLSDEHALDKLRSVLAKQGITHMLVIVDGTPEEENESFLSHMDRNAETGLQVVPQGRRGDHCYFYDFAFAR